MIRPRLRPTISRRNKYIGIAPGAERKLDREARRGSHDLRRLVGHANFLDTLIDTLDVQDEEEGDASAATGRLDGRQDAKAQEQSDEDTSSDEAWSDDEDDEGHTLTRVVTDPALAELVKASRDDTRAAIAEIEHDYFGQVRQAEPAIGVRSEGEKHTSVTVTVAVSPAASGMTEGSSSTSLPSTSPDSVGGDTRAA